MFMSLHTDTRKIMPTKGNYIKSKFIKHMLYVNLMFLVYIKNEKINLMGNFIHLCGRNNCLVVSSVSIQ